MLATKVTLSACQGGNTVLVERWCFSTYSTELCYHSKFSLRC